MPIRSGHTMTRDRPGFTACLILANMENGGVVCRRCIDSTTRKVQCLHPSRHEMKASWSHWDGPVEAKHFLRSATLIIDCTRDCSNT